MAGIRIPAVSVLGHQRGGPTIVPSKRSSANSIPCETFVGLLHYAECPNASSFVSVGDARDRIEAWLADRLQ